MTIKQKIIVSSTLVAVMAAMAGIMSYKNSMSVKGVYVNKIEEWNKELVDLEEIKVSVTEIQGVLLRELYREGNDAATSKAEQNQVLSDTLESLRAKILAYGRLGERQSLVARELTPPMAQLIIIGQSLQYAFNGSTRSTAKNLADLDKVQQKMIPILAEARIEGFAECQEVGAEGVGAFKRILYWTIGVSFLTFLLALIFGQLIARDLSSAIEDLKEKAHQLAEGNYTASGKKSSRKDEFGKLNVSFEHLAEDLQKSKTIEDQNHQLEYLNNELKSKNDSLDSFVYRVSHDLKAPVINIQSLLKVINGQLQNSENEILKKTLFFMDKSTEKLQQTIEDLLEVSRIDRKLNSQKEKIVVHELLEEVISENSKAIEEFHVSIAHDFSQVQEVCFSKMNLKSILANLLSNSIKYHSKDRPPRVDFRSFYEGNYVCLTITDNGLGIDLDKHREKLFGMFNRFHNHVEGSGVGLYIVKKLMDENGGKLEVESEVGEGTTMKLFFIKETISTTTEAAMAVQPTTTLY